MDLSVQLTWLPEEEVFRFFRTYNSNNHHSYAPFRFVETRKCLFYHKDQYTGLYGEWGKEQMNSIVTKLGYTLNLIEDEEWESKWINIPLGIEISSEIVNDIPLLQPGDIFGPLDLSNYLFMNIYKLYSAQFNYSAWAERVRPVLAQQPFVRDFTDDEVKVITRITQDRIEDGKPLSNEHLKNLSAVGTLMEDLAAGICYLREINSSFFESNEKKPQEKFEYKEGEEDYFFMSMLDDVNLDDNEDDGLPKLQYPRDIPMFVKLTSSSAKNETKPKPMYTVNDIIDFMTFRQQFLQLDYKNYFEYKFNQSKGIVLMPWNDHIDNRSEFRVFIRNKQLIAISQQCWYNVFHYTPEELHIIPQSICTMFYTKLRDLLELPSAILDVTVDFKTKQTYLIEINPWATWATSGSALFDWVNDHEIIEPNLKVCDIPPPDKIHFRILHKVPGEEEFIINIDNVIL